MYDVIYSLEDKTKDELGPVGTIISGGVAGTTLWAVIFPADVIKSRQQVNNLERIKGAILSDT